jgi:glycosyltransferase involved in cell wall biosynthesis
MRLLFLHPAECHTKLSEYRNGLVPSHVLWGQAELEERGHKVEVCPRVPSIYLGRRGGLIWRIWQTFWALRRGRQADALVAVEESGILLLLLAKALGILSGPVVLLNRMLLHPRQCGGMRGRLWKWLLGYTDQVVSIASCQARQVGEVYGIEANRLNYLFMPVDSSFFPSFQNTRCERFFLAVGFHSARDFGTLLEALPLGEKLVIITDRDGAWRVRTHRCYGSGIEVYQTVSRVALSLLYQRAGAVVIPLAETPYPCGLRAFVESQARGKVVIVSGSSSMREYVRDGWNGIVVPVGDVGALREALQATLNEPGRFRHIPWSARGDARRRFSSQRFGLGLEAIIERAIAGELWKSNRWKWLKRSSVLKGAQYECVS